MSNSPTAAHLRATPKPQSVSTTAGITVRVFWKVSVSILAGTQFLPDAGGSKFIRNSRKQQPEYRVSKVKEPQQIYLYIIKFMVQTQVYRIVG
jgi:hypothetical protein